MRKPILFAVFALLILSGCATNNPTPNYQSAISFDSERIAYESSGAGKTALIFVHGWSCDARYWRQQVPAFANDYQVVTIDLAGHGHSSQSRSDYSMLSFAKDIKAVIDQEAITSAILIGHSMGGGVIAEAARLMPDVVVGVVGVDTLQNIAEPTPQSMVDELINPFESDFKNAVQDFVAPMFPKGADQQLVNWVKQDMSSAPKGPALSAVRHYLGQYVTGEAAVVFEDVTVPVISINARLWPTNPEENKKHIKHYQLFYIEEVGHFPMLENPAEFNRILGDSIRLIESFPKL